MRLLCDRHPIITRHTRSSAVIAAPTGQGIVRSWWQWAVTGGVPSRRAALRMTGHFFARLDKRVELAAPPSPVEGDRNIILGPNSAGRLVNLCEPSKVGAGFLFWPSWQMHWRGGSHLPSWRMKTIMVQCRSAADDGANERSDSAAACPVHRIERRCPPVAQEHCAHPIFPVTDSFAPLFIAAFDTCFGSYGR